MTDSIKVVDETQEQAETFALVITEKTVGSLNTNIAMLEELVEKRLEDYKPENYMGDADLAKKDRAELNKAKETIKQSRKTIIDELMKPYADFEERCKKLEKRIEQASSALDEIVKIKESDEKEQKRKKIELFWQTKNFNLFPLEKIFNPKWLNKTYKESDILNEMDLRIERTYKDLQTIERFNADEADVLKAHYLMSLDIVETMNYAGELERQKEVAQQEKASRQERETDEKILKQKEDLYNESVELENRKPISSLADEALGIESSDDEEKKEFVITVNATETELIKIKEQLNLMRIVYSAEELKF